MACLALTNYCFILVEVVAKLELGLMHWYSYTYICLYELIFILIVWSYIRLSFSDPGFIPKGYAYKINELSPLDQELIRIVI